LNIIELETAMKRMAMKGVLCEPGLPRTKAIRTGQIDARSQLSERHGAKPIQKQGWRPVKLPK
jgi:hypothetical protein